LILAFNLGIAKLRVSILACILKLAFSPEGVKPNEYWPPLV
jgi:hypothetical protein